MASRPVFVPNFDTVGVRTFDVSFTWQSGMSISQKRKNIAALHSAASSIGLLRMLEISTKSPDQTGVLLSAFNLSSTTTKHGMHFTVESAFQSSKVFERGGPFVDLLTAESRTAKKDPRLRESGRVVGFLFLGQSFPTVPPTLFYDWLYVNTLVKNGRLAKAILQYEAFTDIEFNPEKSINCQAYSAALFVSLSHSHRISGNPISLDEFKRATDGVYSNPHSPEKQADSLSNRPHVTRSQLEFDDA